jgi:hypothetical protein
MGKIIKPGIKKNDLRPGFSQPLLQHIRAAFQEAIRFLKIKMEKVECSCIFQ